MINRQRKLLIVVSLAFFSFAMATRNHDTNDDEMAHHQTIYEFSVKDADGKEVSLEKYKGQVVVVVNVASQCGFTNSNYAELKELHDKYHEQGLRVAAFPCNQFGKQEPGCAIDVVNFVKETFNYEPDMYAKVKVNGNEADPFWTFLKKEQGGTLLDAIKWNFTKFLVDRKGHVIARYAPTSSPASFEDDIKAQLAKPE